ncbi:MULTISPECIES: putative 2OG-Fe(II) oxygenase [unclassified Brevundimonas]|jgi:hypothetical protein|uniref:putative 2OG-Fe(II) oxygenase n=1 Tax=unclassified Brevundimonas TaxID=2622653 RepID=UPI000C49300C|nr:MULTISPECIES: putative 2OG-Fe(II) oxygenase [unclassified Brevundimonas]MAL88986.1 hypothetical protein [Brevundimonas sp.]HAV49744.1 hypothetical protein [Brevundimonas sp.]|tara:strand:+ start:3490 stop:4650 length:1161 start_codon:yes stop_codon:yes gene_type:complete
MIDWQDSPKGRIPYSVQLELAEAALARQPGSPRLLASIGVLHERLRRPRKALAALEASLTADPNGFEAWAELARVRAHTGDVEAAMLVCRIGLERQPRANIARVWGNLLAAQNRLDAALVAYRLALDLPGFDIAAMQRLFALRTERQRDLWLDDLEDLPLAYSDTAVGLAWRAAALSAVGQRDAALAIMNPERQPRRIPFEPPAEFGGIDSFNRRLAAEVIADPPTTPDSADFQLNTTPRATSQPAWRALGVFIRTELERAALQPEWFGLEGARRPTMARLVSISTVLTADASNRQHMHQAGYLTAIYHVQVPDSVRDDNTRAGALELGGCDQILPDFEPCWNRAWLKPRAGWLTLIPSHMFHDVIPTGTREPRISTAADLTPVWA